jgi:hypothetical protein
MSIEAHRVSYQTTRELQDTLNKLTKTGKIVGFSIEPPMGLQSLLIAVVIIESYYHGDIPR